MTMLSRPSAGIIGTLFCGYLAVALPLPVLPLFIHNKLGFGSFVVGGVLGVQFLATVLSRGYAGRLTDQRGGKRSAVQGATVCALGAFFYVIAAGPGLSPPVSLAFVVAGRITAGLGESQFVTGCVTWSIASVGPQRAGMSMSWTGIAMFAALALGAPVGMAVYRAYGLEATMIACVAAPLLSAAIAGRIAAYRGAEGEPLAFRRVICQIWREGLGVMLQGVGLAALSAFATLDFAVHGWHHGGEVMTAFGVGFIVVRLGLGHLPDRMGGFRVAFWSFITEAIGQLLVWWAPNEWVALAGALVTGSGCALVYPALGIEVLRRILPTARGSALGAFSAFLDIAYGLTGPAAGLIAGQAGYAAVFILGAGCALLGVALVIPPRASRRSASAHRASSRDRQRVKPAVDAAAHRRA